MAQLTHGSETEAVAVAALAPGHGSTSLPAVLADQLAPFYVAAPDGRVGHVNAPFIACSAAIYGVEIGPGSDGHAIPALAEIFARLDAGEAEVVRRHSVRVGETRRHFAARHFRLPGASAGYAGILEDRTREHLAARETGEIEARYTDLVRSTSDWVFELDSNLNLTFASQRIAEVLDVPAATLTGRNLFSLGRFETGGDTLALGAGKLASYSPFRGRIFLMQDSAGRHRRIALSGVPVFDDASGRFLGYRGTGTDVTRQHEAERLLQSSQTRLEASLAALTARNAEIDAALARARAADLAKTEFLGRMSHELRTPLNAIIGFSEMSIQQMFGALNERYLGYFRDIRGAATHLLSIINDLLDTVNIESNRVAIETAPVRLAKVLAEARALVVVRAERQRIELAEPAMDQDWIVAADAGRLRQILVNLLTNATKFTRAGGRAGIDVGAGPEGWVDIAVWDTGIGIPADELERVFESFHQVGAQVPDTASDGVGLGLSISRQLARLMGGEITAESTVGRGARFTLRLPLSPAEPAAR